MRVYYSNKPIDNEVRATYTHSIFLAGPTPRSKNVLSWRPKAIRILKDT